MANTTPDGAQVPDPDAVDEAWCESTDARTREARDKLFGELRMYQNNVINESIRMAHQDLGDHFRDAGEMEEALLHYEKTREYCTTNEHALEMYMRAMQVAWDMQQHATVLAYTDKAESVLATLAEVDVALPGHTDPWRSALAHGTASGSSAIRALFHAGGGGGGESASFASARTALDSEKRTSHAHFTARIKAYRALAQWAQCDVRAPLPPVACDAVRAEAYADIVSPSLIAWYALLSALSVAPPEQRKRAESLAGDDEFRACAESDPAPRDALAAYLASDFRKCLGILAAHQVRRLSNADDAPAGSGAGRADSAFDGCDPVAAPRVLPERVPAHVARGARRGV